VSERTVAAAVAGARDALRASGVPADEAPGDAEVLARHVLGWDLTRFAVHRNDPVPDGFEQPYAALIERRSLREPVSQIVGHREFWGLHFEVTRDVLTPRPETELVVQAALSLARRDRPLLVVDVGTGSGCLAVALAVELPNARVIATDISPQALAVARTNAARHSVADRIRFVEADLLPDTIEHANLIVSNPPYVAVREGASLPPEVREYEPAIALFAGADGLGVYRRLLAAARVAVDASGHAIVELGYNQAADVTEIARARGWAPVETRRDLQGLDRVLTLRPIE
jgi:release factor glutamine methyltransferase